MAYDFKAATLSKNNLVGVLGTTTERELGLMEIVSKSEWITKLTNKGYTTGPTGDWKNEWLSVYQFLDYGDFTCYVGSTGSTGSYTSQSTTNTPLHNKSLVEIDVVFDCGTTFSAEGAKKIAEIRKDCLALVGNHKNITTPITTGYSDEETDFGITLAASEYVFLVAGRKQIDSRVSTTLTWPSTYVTLNCSPDVAGIMAFNTDQSGIFTPAAGIGNTKAIKNIVSLTQYLDDTEGSNLITNDVNVIKQYPGIGTFMLGNKTYKGGTSSVTRANVMILVNNINREVKKVLQRYLYKENNAITRNTVKTEVTNTLNNTLSATGGAVTGTVKCDAENNTSLTQLVVEIILIVPSISETINLTLINSATGETLTTTTISN